MFDEVITHLEKALEYAQDLEVPVDLLDMIDNAIAAIEEYQSDLEGQG